MKFMRSSFAAGLMLAWLVAGPIYAQQNQDPGRHAPQQENLETRVFQVKNMDLYEAYHAVEQLFSSRNTALLEQASSIVVRDTPEVLDKIAELLEQMQQLKPEQPATDLIQVVPLTHRDPDMVTVLLGELFHNAHIIPDLDSGQILLKSDDATEISEILRIIKSLDVSDRQEQQVKTLAITIDFIRAKIGAQDGGSLPPNLQKVGTALRESGLGGLSVYGHLMVRTQEGEGFQGKGVVRSGAGTDAAAFIKISGQAELVGDRVQLQVRSNLSIPITFQRGRDNAGEPLLISNYEDLDLSTTTTVPLGDYLVLGAMPASTGDSDTILMVIHITAE